MPVRLSNSAHNGSQGGSGQDRELSRLRNEIEALRKLRSDVGFAETRPSRLPLLLSGIALVVAIVALFR